MPIHLAEVDLARPGHLGAGQWRLRKLRGINVLFGKNGSGKSLLLRALRNSDPTSCHYIVPERSGDITFEPGLIAEVVEAIKRQNSSQGNFASNYRQQVVTRIQGYYTRRGTKRKEDIDHDPDDLLKAMALILPDFTVAALSDTPFYDLRRTRDDQRVTSVSTLSSGESQLLALGLDMVTMLGIWELDRQQKRVLLIDEPDAHIHPDLQIKFADFLCHIARQFKVQLFVATHSTTLLAALGQFGGDDVGIVFVRADVAEMRAEPFDAVGRELAALLGGHLLMGPLFGAPILLVEGDDDYRVWVQASRSGSIGLCVLPGNGDEIKKYRASLEKVFAALSDNAQLRGYAIVDGDKYEHEVPAAQYVPFIRLNCHEIENLYLSNEVLAAMGHTWETAVAAISQEAHRFGERQEELLELSAIDRQSADLKELIPHIAEILDKKGLLWTVRLGKVIGASRPSGMLSEFLGPEVMAALWPAVPEAASAPS